MQSDRVEKERREKLRVKGRCGASFLWFEGEMQNENAQGLYLV